MAHKHTSNQGTISPISGPTVIKGGYYNAPSNPSATPSQDTGTWGTATPSQSPSPSPSPSPASNDNQ
jgi:hypothetical protein